MCQKCIFFYAIGCLPFCKKIIRLEVKWKSYFPGSPFGNYRLPPDVVLFISVRNGTEAVSLPISQIFRFSVSY